MRRSSFLRDLIHEQSRHQIGYIRCAQSRPAGIWAGWIDRGVGLARTTGRELYRMFVRERGWTSHEYPD
jgi:hypothetical protein